MALERLQVLMDHERTTTLNAGNLDQPSASDAHGEIGVDEVGEIVAYELIAPVDGNGDPEDLQQFWPIIDGTSRQENINLPGRDDINMTPVSVNIITDGIWRKTQFWFGLGLRSAIKESQRTGVPVALLNTTIKFKRRNTIIAQAGGSNVTNNYRIRAIGYLYNEQTLERLVRDTGVSGISTQFTINDPVRNRTLRVPGASNIPIRPETWDQLPGGALQSGDVEINPFARFGTNANASTANTRYELRFDTGNVGSQFEDLFFDHEVFPRILIVDRFGMRSAANVAAGFVHFFGTGDPVSSDLPPSLRNQPGYPATNGLNELTFGRASDFVGSGVNLYHPVQQAVNNNLVIARDRAVVSFIDNGNSVAADSVTGAIAGKMIDLPED